MSDAAQPPVGGVDDSAGHRQVLNHARRSGYAAGYRDALALAHDLIRRMGPAAGRRQLPELMYPKDAVAFTRRILNELAEDVREAAGGADKAAAGAVRGRLGKGV